MSNDKTLELQIRIAAEEASRIVSALKGEIKDLSDEAGKFSKNEGANLKNSFKEAETAAKDTVTSIGDIKNALGSLAEVVVAAKALSFIKDMGIFALETADNFQSMKNQFGILLGDMEAGAGLFNEIKAFNDVTPFDLDTLTQATNVLVAAKVPLQDLQSQLTKFGDLSQGNSQRLTSYVNAFSQAAAKGKADMQVLNTYLHQGVPILDALAKNFNVTTAEIVEMSSQGQISFADFSRALDDLTAAGGQYFGGMELSSQSLSAMQEGLKEATNSLAASYGEIFMPAAIAVVKVLTDITNAINESPITKGLLTGALVALTGYLSAMAVKAGIAFTAQMKLNLAVGALNPVVLASTIAVAGLAAGLTIYSAHQQKASQEAEQAALTQYKQRDAINATSSAVNDFTNALKNMSDANINNNITTINSEIMTLQRNIREYSRIATEYAMIGNNIEARKWGDIVISEREQLDIARQSLEAARSTLTGRRTNWIDEMYGGTQTARIEKINEQLRTANQYLSGENLSETDRQRLIVIVRGLNDELSRLNNQGPVIDINKIASDWKAAWAEIYKQFQADQSDDPYARINLENEKKIAEALANYVLETDQEVIDQINEYYEAQRKKVFNQLADEEARIAEVAANTLKEYLEEEGSLRRTFNRSRIDDIEHEMQTALDAIKEIEDYRISAAEESEEQIAAIREYYAQMRDEAHMYFKIEIDTATLQEAREAVKSWENELSDSLLRLMINLEGLGENAAVIISDLTSQFLQLSVSAAMSGFEEFGKALGEGEEAMDSMGRALVQMTQQILNQLPMMFLQAGLQLIANNQIPMGLAFVAAGGVSAIVSGVVKGATKHAHGGVFDEYGQAARTFASGGAFTNQIVSSPTYFTYGSNFGLMGEAGPEAIMPLTRMPNGNLGVQTAGSGSIVNIVIHNYSGEAVHKEETENSEGGKNLDIFISEAINRHLSSGKADRAMTRYGSRPVGV